MWKWINGAWTWYSDPWWGSPPWARELGKGLGEINDKLDTILAILKDPIDPVRLQTIEDSIKAQSKKLKDAVDVNKT